MSINHIGYWSGAAAFIAAAAYGIVQIMQVIGMLRFPADEILIYGTSLCIVVPFILEMAAFHHLTAPEKQFWTHTALIFATVYAVFVTANYVV
jgi:heme/copper-type cytochrome/quinol oxidase subunit 4